MVTLYDEAKVMEIHDYNVEQRGIEKVIHSLVITMRDFSASKDATIEKLVSELGLSPHAAEEKVQKYWEQ